MLRREGGMAGGAGDEEPEQRLSLEPCPWGIPISRGKSRGGLRERTWLLTTAGQARRVDPPWTDMNAWRGVQAVC